MKRVCVITGSGSGIGFAAAQNRGEVKTVIHAAGMSPQMGDAQKIMEANALGTVNINDAFYDVMKTGGCSPFKRS